MKEKDKYDLQIEELTEHPELIDHQWGEGIGLFQFASIDGDGHFLTGSCGCLTMIRASEHRKVQIGDFELNEELTKEIRKDERIPNDHKRIGPDDFQVLAEWQRKLDKYRNK